MPETAAEERDGDRKIPGRAATPGIGRVWTPDAETQAAERRIISRIRPVFERDGKFGGWRRAGEKGSATGDETAAAEYPDADYLEEALREELEELYGGADTAGADPERVYERACETASEGTAVALAESVLQEAAKVAGIPPGDEAARNRALVRIQGAADERRRYWDA